MFLHFHLLDSPLVMSRFHNKKFAVVLSAVNRSCPCTFEKKSKLAKGLAFPLRPNEFPIDLDVNCSVPDHKEAAADVSLLE